MGTGTDEAPWRSLDKRNFQATPGRLLIQRPAPSCTPWQFVPASSTGRWPGVKETGYISQHKKPQVTQHVLARLGERTGPVNGLFLFRLLDSTGTEGIFIVLHIAKTLLSRELEFVLNDAYEAQVFVRATSTADNDVLQSASAKERVFSLAHAIVKIYNIVELNLVPRKEDKLLNMPLCTYPQEYDHLSVDRMRQLSYPTGFSCEGDPIEK